MGNTSKKIGAALLSRKHPASSGARARRPRRLVESPAEDWARWDAAAEQMGQSWHNFARRALDAYAAGITAELALLAIGGRKL